jgi:uncharacterized membrane protein YbhN (UPF0104 family)
VKLAGVLHGVSPLNLAAMLPVVLLIYAFRALGWWVTLRTAGVRVGLGRTLAITYAGHLMIFMPAGDLARAALVHESDGADEGTAAGTVAFQELTFLTLLALGVVPSVVVRPSIGLLVLLVLAAHGLVFAILLSEDLYEWAVKVVERWRWLRRFDRQLRSLRPAFVVQIQSWSLARVVAFNGAGALLMMVLFYLSLMAVGAGRVGFVDAAYTYSLAHIFSGLSFLPGGVGSLEVIATGLLVAHGIPASQGAAATLLFRGFNDVVMLVAGAVAAFALRHTTKRADSSRAPRAEDRGVRRQPSTP